MDIMIVGIGNDYTDHKLSIEKSVILNDRKLKKKIFYCENIINFLFSSNKHNMPHFNSYS